MIDNNYQETKNKISKTSKNILDGNIDTITGLRNLYSLLAELQLSKDADQEGILNLILIY